MKITIITVGKLKEKYLIDGIQEYKKRCSRYAEIEEIVVNDEKAPENLSEKEIDLIKDKEGEAILNKLPSSTYLIALAIDGKNLSSEELAAKFEEIQTYHSSSITFVIGGSLGLSNQVLSIANFKLSFGKMTYPHQLMKLILIEQIYRVFRINHNEPYHK